MKSNKNRSVSRCDRCPAIAGRSAARRDELDLSI